MIEATKHLNRTFCVLFLTTTIWFSGQPLWALPVYPANSHGIASPKVDDPNGNYLGESLQASLQAAKERLFRLIAKGLRYATTKLCDNEMVGDLNDLNKAIESSFQSIDQAQNAFALAQESSLQHLNAAYAQRKSHPARSMMETNLAKEQLKKMADKNAAIGDRLNSIYGQLVKSEALYQRIAAECLLDDFKSFFGPGKAPAPKPEIPDDVPGDVPDEYFGIDGLPDPEIDLLLFEID